MSDRALRQVADELRNIRRSIDWNDPPHGSLYAALRQTEGVAREALGEPLPTDFNHRGKYTTLARPGV
jgi:hypothetical protein